MDGLPEYIEVKRLVGGLAPDSDRSMPDETRAYVQSQWHRIEETIPGRKFNFDFWSKCQPRRSTYPACRAVIAAREQGEANDILMTKAIQRAYYEQARNPSDLETLVDLAGEIGLDAAIFAKALASSAVDKQLDREIGQSRALGARGLPSLVLVDGDFSHLIPIDYLDSAPMLAAIRFY